MSKKSKFKISVIIPVYNVEEYISETLDCLINQTIGFEENVQVILVNDGSPDNSEKVCLEYKNKYPNNIEYILKENGGVSSARNEGIKHVEGKYVNFLDADDLWEPDALEKACNFLDNNKDVDVVSMKLKFFGARESDNHPLNNKFDGEQIVNIIEEYDKIQMSAVTVVIRAEAIDLEFSKDLKYAEDSLFINKIILKKKKYGTIGTTHYMYRKRGDGTSALDNSLKSKNYYINTLKYFHKELIEYCLKEYKEVPKYIQFIMMYDLQWKIKSKLIDGVLTNKEVEDMKNELQEVLQHIDDEIIVSQKQLPPEYKEATFRIKYKKDFPKRIKLNNNELYINNSVLYNLDKVLHINILEIKKDEIDIKGYLPLPLITEKVQLIYDIDGKEKEVSFDQNEYHKLYVFNDIYNKNKYFKIREKIQPNTKIKFYIKINNQKSKIIKINFGQLSKLSNKYRLFYNSKKHTVKYSKKEIIVENRSTLKSLKYEIILLLQMIKHLEIKSVIYRMMYNIAKLFTKKKIWLISDRPTAATDNGYHFFKYVISKQNKNIKPYFVINENSEDYNKMKKIGKVLKYNSINYKIKFLLADKIISSQADLWVQNAFGNKNELYRDLYKFDMIFLQHGIIMTDLSTWLKAYDKNIKLFVTSSEREYNSIVNGNYGFGKEVVKLTGLPRYDNLKSKPTKQIVIMPTWRNYLSSKFENAAGTRAYSEEFKNSEYFNHFNKLINDEDILNEMKKHGYKGLLVVHPAHEKNYVDFQENEIFKINKGMADYQKIFKESDLMITDYSSVHFDFAYLKKPVIYSQFDYDQFFAGHTSSEGYFNYKKDCFGPVVYSYEETKKEIIKAIQNKCKIENKYKQKIEKFYKYTDKNNCKRVYEEILKIDKNK